MTTFLKELKEHVDIENNSKFAIKVREVKEIIKESAVDNESKVWVYFYPEDGDYKKVVEYFNNEGIETFGPTGHDRGGQISILFKWKI